MGAVSSRNVIDADTELMIVQLAGEGQSARQIAKRLGVSRSAVHRRIDAAREAEDVVLVAGLAAGLAAEEDEERLERLAAVAVDDPTALALPFEYAGLVDGTVRWRDASGIVFGELDLYRWRQRPHQVDPTAYAATYAECEAATDAAYASVDAAGVVWDDGRRRWVQRPRAVS